jgi:hypothetical protein
MEFLISSLGGIPLGIKNGIDVEFPIYPWEFPGYKGIILSHSRIYERSKKFLT